MIKIEDLITSDAQLRNAEYGLEVNALTNEGVLREAQLLDVRLDALRSTVALLFELRTATQFRRCNTGVLVARGIQGLLWTAPRRTTVRTAWTVDHSTVRVDQLFTMELVMWPSPGAELELRAEAIEFCAGEVPELSAAPPDYVTDDESTIRSQLVNWQSEFVLREVYVPHSMSTR